MLVGGSSSVGKTTLARDLARGLECAHVSADELRGGVDDTRVQFFARTSNPWRLEAGVLCRALRGAARAMRPALAEVVDAALATRRSVVLEGESLDPGLAERYVGDARVRSVFVVELDEERIARTLRARSTSFGRLTARERATVAATNAMYCRWLEAECARRGLACVASQPWATLAGRAEQVLGAGPRS